VTHVHGPRLQEGGWGLVFFSFLLIFIGIHPGEMGNSTQIGVGVGGVDPNESAQPRWRLLAE